MKSIEAVDEKEKAYLDLSKSDRVVKARKGRVVFFSFLVLCSLST